MFRSLKDFSEFLVLSFGLLFLLFCEQIISAVKDFVAHNVCLDGINLDIVLLSRNIYIRQRFFYLENEDVIGAEIFQSKFNGFKLFFGQVESFWFYPRNKFE